MSGVMAQIPQKGCALITGAGGRLGHLLRAAYALNAQTLPPFVFQSRQPGADIQWSEGDPTDLLPRGEAVIALWGATSGDPETLSENTRLADLSTQVAQEIGASRVLHISTAAVYGPGQNINEDHPTDNCNIYGKSKLDMERHVARLSATGTLTHICLRLANVVGADSLAPALRSSEPVKMDMFNDDPTAPVGPIRSYIGAGDLLWVMHGLLNLPAEHWPATLNVACPRPIAMDALLRAADKDVIYRPAPASASAEVTLDVSRLEALLPSVTFHTTAPALIKEWRRLEGHRKSHKESLG